jgi:hypothetical protein
MLGKGDFQFHGDSIPFAVTIFVISRIIDPFRKDTVYGILAIIEALVLVLASAY